MKNWLRNTLIFTSGAAVGGAASAFACRWAHQKIVEQMNAAFTDEVCKELDKIKGDYEDRINELEAKMAGVEENSPKVIPEEVTEKSSKKSTKKETKKQGKAEAVDYTKFSQGKKGITVADIKKQAQLLTDEVKIMPTETYIVGLEDFSEENGYAKLTYEYFKQDEVFVDEFETPDLDVGARVMNVIHQWEQTGGTDDIYARNDELETDFEIVYHEGSYAEYMSKGQ